MLLSRSVAYFGTDIRKIICYFLATFGYFCHSSLLGVGSEELGVESWELEIGSEGLGVGNWELKVRDKKNFNEVPAIALFDLSITPQ